MDTQVKFMLWNARSIRGKISEYFDFLMENKIDISMVTETWLEKNDKFAHPSYKCFRIDRPNRRGGGVALVINNSLKVRQLKCVDTGLIENIVAELFINDHEILKMVCVYFPGGRANGTTRSIFKSDLRKILGIGGDYVICGDFNSKHRDWGCFRANSWGNILSDLTLSFPFTIRYPNNPTHIPCSSNSRPSTIDLILTNVPHFMNFPVVMNELNSDHLPVMFSIFTTELSRIQNLQYDFKKTNWNRYKSYLSTLLSQNPLFDNIANSDDINALILYLNDSIIAAIDESTPKIEIRNKFVKLPNYILNSIKQRNYFRQQWNRYRNRNDLLIYREYDKLVKYEIWCFRNRSWNNKIKALDIRSKPFWNISKMLRRKIHNIPAISHSNRSHLLDADKANVFANQFLSNHNNSNDIQCRTTELQVSNALTDFNNSFYPTPESSVHVSASDIKCILKQLKVGKSCGLDKIQNLYLKNFSNLAILYLCKILSACLKHQYFPITWRKAKVIPIPKPGKPHDLVSSYRPISLLSNLSKIFEKILKEKLWAYCDNTAVIPDEQFGFRAFHGTIHQIKRVTQYVNHELVSKRSAAMVLLDVEKAFDTVWHDGLIFKLIKLKFPRFLIKIIQTFLYKRSFCVQINKDSSDYFDIPAGVPQGSVLGPLLYLIYTSDFPQIANCTYAFFADDTAILCSGLLASDILSCIQEALDEVAKFSEKWKIKINSEKSQAIFFTRKRKTCYIPQSNLIMKGSDIAWSNSVRYLGVFLNTRLTFNDHVSHIINKFNLAIKLLYPLINRKSELNIENKITILKSIFQPIALYACPVWGICAKSHIKKIQVCQNKLLKLMLNLPWHFSTRSLHDLSHVDFINNRITHISGRFKIICSASENNYISNLYNR